MEIINHQAFYRIVYVFMIIKQRNKLFIFSFIIYHDRVNLNKLR